MTLVYAREYEDGSTFLECKTVTSIEEAADILFRMDVLPYEARLFLDGPDPDSNDDMEKEWRRRYEEEKAVTDRREYERLKAKYGAQK